MRLLYFFVLFALLAVVLEVTTVAAGPERAPGESPVPDMTQMTTEANRLYFPILIAALVAYYLMVRFAEKRPVTELTHRAVLGAVVGIVMGTVLMSVVVALIWICQGISFEGTGTPENWLNVLFRVGIFAGVFEEIVSRGVLFRLAEEIIGSWGAVILSGALFGASHLGNDNANWLSAVSIAVSAGVLFPVVYMLTRNLWVSIGLHAAWNVVQGIVFGIPVSGIASSGLLVTHPKGPEIISGGAFGAEASIIVPIVLIAVSAYLGVRANREGKVVAPYWAKRRGATFGSAALLRA